MKCPQCSKTYKTRTWLHKHFTNPKNHYYYKIDMRNPNFKLYDIPEKGKN